MATMTALRADDPRHLGPYRLLHLLGEGGQGTVYLGEDTGGGLVAIKILHARLADDARARRLFLREGSLAREVEPYCTARVLHAGVEDDRPYIVSEYIEGESLEDLVRRTGPRDRGSVERLAIGTAAALNGIHRAGIVHRDFKPSNVLLAPDGPRVIDFGIARAVASTTTVTSGVLGTPAYMSPEQVAGDEVGPASDVFSWAVTLTFAATGEPAFGADGIPAVLHRIINADPDLSAFPEHRRELLAACLDKEPVRRPTMAEVLTELHGGAPAPRPPAPAAVTVPETPLPRTAARPGTAPAPPPSGSPPGDPPPGSAPPSGPPPGGVPPAGPPPGSAPLAASPPPPAGAAPGAGSTARPRPASTAPMAPGRKAGGPPRARRDNAPEPMSPGLLLTATVAQVAVAVLTALAMGLWLRDAPALQAVGEVLFLALGTTAAVLLHRRNRRRRTGDGR
ncbi:serine/threonine-protein kinase [Spirillospora sp. CA-255316]